MTHNKRNIERERRGWFCRARSFEHTKQSLNLQAAQAGRKRAGPASSPLALDHSVSNLVPNFACEHVACFSKGDGVTRQKLEVSSDLSQRSKETDLYCHGYPIGTGICAVHELRIPILLICTETQSTLTVHEAQNTQLKNTTSGCANCMLQPCRSPCCPS